MFVCGLMTCAPWLGAGCAREARRDPPTHTVVWYVRGLECPNCAANVERALKALPGVRTVEARWDSPEVRLSVEDGSEPALADAQAALAKIEEAIVLSDQPPPPEPKAGRTPASESPAAEPGTLASPPSGA